MRHTLERDTQAKVKGTGPQKEEKASSTVGAAGPEDYGREVYLVCVMSYMLMSVHSIKMMQK